jgi:hypothetical protein
MVLLFIVIVMNFVIWIIYDCFYLRYYYFFIDLNVLYNDDDVIMGYVGNPCRYIIQLF